MHLSGDYLLVPLNNLSGHEQQILGGAIISAAWQGSNTGGVGVAYKYSVVNAGLTTLTMVSR